MKYKDLELQQLIEMFLSQHRESELWDVKQEWYERTEDLIKDIICFSNTVHDEDCYLIIGVTDEFKVCGVSGKRFKQSDILDTLSNLQFAGDNIPKIELKTILMPSDFESGALVNVDVVIIYNTYMTPIYLKKKYGNMVQGCIYSRVGDKNTPNNGNAEIGQIEMLWRKRLGLTKTPFEYIIDSLSRKLEWHVYDESWYNIYRPEYVLRLYQREDYDRYTDEFYSYSQTNESTYFYILDIIANNTVLHQYQIVCLDGGRLTIPVPQLGSFDIRNSHFEKDSYKYYIEGSNRYRVLEFMYDSDNSDERWAFRHLSRVVLIFRSDDERKGFEGYVESLHSDFVRRVEQCDEYDYINTGKERKTEVYKRELRVGIILNEMLDEYRKEFPDKE